jgi:Zn-dependent protease with chaperone function
MPLVSPLLLIGFLAQVTAGGAGVPPAAVGGAGVPPAGVATALPGREVDARVAAVGFRLADQGRARCPMLVPAVGLVLQHLVQFEPADRASVVAALPLGRGPGVIALVPGGPAEAAGIRAGDVLLAIDGAALPAESGLAGAFDAARAHARADAIDDLFSPVGHPLAIDLLRDGATVRVSLTPRPVCPSRVRLARSDQRNGYADGRHVFLTTGLLERLRGDDELAFVIAHEMAHNVLGHAAVMRGGDVRGGLGRTLGRSGRIVRDIERAADRLAGELMLDAGYDPVAGVGMLRRVGGTDLGIALFASHAPVGERIAAMRALVAETPQP